MAGNTLMSTAAETWYLLVQTHYTIYYGRTVKDPAKIITETNS